MVSLQDVHGLSVEVIEFPAGLMSKPLEEQSRQHRYVLLAFPERWEFQSHYCQTVVKIASKQAFIYKVSLSPVSRRNDSDICLQCLTASDSLEFTFLQHTQQLDLNPRRHFCNFIKEQRAFVRQLEATNPFG